MRLWIREFRSSRTTKVAVSVNTLSEPVANVKQVVADVTNVPAEEQELVYGGKTLLDQSTLESCGVTCGATLHLLRRVCTAPPAASPLIARIPSFRDALQNPRFVLAVCQVMQNPAVVRELFFTPEVAVSAESRALLEQPNFLLRLGDPTQMTNVFAEHPVLADIAQERLEAYLTSYMVAHGHNQGSLTSWPPSIDDLCDVIEESLQQFDDSDLDASASEDDVDMAIMDELDHHEHMAMAMAQPQPASSSGITSTHLASALSALSSTTPSSSPAQLSPAVQQPSTSNGDSPAAITADVFSHALAGALEASSSTSPRSTSSSAQRSRSRPRSHRRPEDRRQQLNAMREMGIADEAICIQALEATNGDVMAAVNLIFTDGFL